MRKTQNLASVLAIAISLSALPVMADDDMSGTGMGDTTRTSGPTGTPETSGEGGSASREGLVTEPNYQAGISAEAFIEEATEKNHAIINAAEAALDEDNGVADVPDVRKFAQQMIEVHKQLNRQLSELAAGEQLEVSDTATLVDRAQSMILSVRDDESFLEAYAKNQVADHQELLDVFERAAASDHGEVSRFAKSTLPSIQKHLQQARNLHPEMGNENGQ